MILLQHSCTLLLPVGSHDEFSSSSDSIAMPDKQIPRAGNFVDLVQQADYNKYFDSVGPKSGTQLAVYAEFSLKSIRAAAAEGRNILNMFPYDAINDARDALAQ